MKIYSEKNNEICILFIQFIFINVIFLQKNIDLFMRKKINFKIHFRPTASQL